jgi:hypothetical protein
MQMSWCEPTALILSAVLVMAIFGPDAGGGSDDDGADGRAQQIDARLSSPRGGKDRGPVQHTAASSQSHGSVKDREQRIGARRHILRIDGANVQSQAGAEALHLDLAVHVTIDPDSFEMLDLWIELMDNYIEIEPDSQYELGPEPSLCCASVMT